MDLTWLIPASFFIPHLWLVCFIVVRVVGGRKSLWFLHLLYSLTTSSVLEGHPSFRKVWREPLAHNKWVSSVGLLENLSHPHTGVLSVVFTSQCWVLWSRMFHQLSFQNISLQIAITARTIKNLTVPLYYPLFYTLKWMQCMLMERKLLYLIKRFSFLFDKKMLIGRVEILKW